MSTGTKQGELFNARGDACPGTIGHPVMRVRKQRGTRPALGKLYHVLPFGELSSATWCHYPNVERNGWGLARPVITSATRVTCDRCRNTSIELVNRLTQLGCPIVVVPDHGTLQVLGDWLEEAGHEEAGDWARRREAWQLLRALRQVTD